VARKFVNPKTAKLLMKPLVFQGHGFLRQRLLLSILSGRPIKVEKIRSDQSEPGLKGVSFSSFPLTLEQIMRFLYYGFSRLLRMVQ
jgi:hypothetical protein